MPYKASGSNVMIKKGSKWVILKKHPNPEAARKHAAALNINAHRPRKKGK